ncbi:hypothetical protein [Furfurilactobacillus milii]|uniref:Uncharacterized protein n=1 Tax=Furfurilactobacillus rossiae TaxID=231049 RepID=A0A7C9IXT9_9LACO|nr:hypothetical protein [Furfurilactobacillus milii]MYV04458.1 hypothetical protein [Furfurilactobacillus milii]
MSVLATINWDSVITDGASVVSIMAFIGTVVYYVLKSLVEHLTTGLKGSVDVLNSSITGLTVTIKRNNEDLGKLREDMDNLKIDDVNHEDRISAIEKERNQS